MSKYFYFSLSYGSNLHFLSQHAEYNSGLNWQVLTSQLHHAKSTDTLTSESPTDKDSTSTYVLQLKKKYLPIRSSKQE